MGTHPVKKTKINKKQSMRLSLKLLTLFIIFVVFFELSNAKRGGGRSKGRFGKGGKPTRVDPYYAKKERKSSSTLQKAAVVGAVAFTGYQVGKMEGKFSNYHWDNGHSEYNFETWNKWRQADGFLCRNDTDCNWLDDYLECQKVGDFGWSINSDWFGGERPIGECGCEAWYDWNNDNLECELSDHGTYMTNGLIGMLIGAIVLVCCCFGFCCFANWVTKPDTSFCNNSFCPGCQLEH